MSEVKFSNDLFIGKNELERFKLFLDKKGWRQHFTQKMLSPGIIKNPYTDSSFQNGKVEVEDLVNFKIRIQQLKAIDKNCELILLNDIKKISIPFQDIWYWVKCSYISTNVEQGTFSIDTSGNLTGVSSELTKVLRGYPNFQVRVKFANATLNTGEYDIIEVSSDTAAILQGDVFQSETDLQLQIVGTFTPGIVVPTLNKFPFVYDSSTIELVEESTPNVAPTKVAGVEFYLARVRARIEGGSTYIIDIQDKRTEILLDNDVYKQIQILSNSITAIDQIRWENSFSNKQSNNVRMSWGVRSSTWSVDTTLNEVFLSNAEGGLIKDISTIVADQFVGWRLYSPKGIYSNILSVTLSGGGVKCRLDRLIIEDFSSDGGVTLYTDNILLTPNAEEVNFSFLEVGTKNEFFFKFNINDKYGFCNVPINSTTQTQYLIKTRYKTVNDYTQYINIADDVTNGYYNENQFDSLGDLIVSPVRTTYSNSLVYLLTSVSGSFSSGFIALLLGFNEPIILKGCIVTDNGGTIDVTAGTAFINGVVISVNAYSGVDNVYLNSSGQYVLPLPANESILFNPFTSQYFDDVVKRHTTKQYEVISIEQVDETKWDGTGLGKWNWKGFARCNGQNGTVDRRGIFAVGASDVAGDYDIGDSGGSETHTLTNAEKGKLTVSVKVDDIDGGIATGIAAIKMNGIEIPLNGGSNQTSYGTEQDINLTASDPHENRPPFKPLWYIMRTA